MREINLFGNKPEVLVGYLLHTGVIFVLMVCNEWFCM